MLRRHIADYSLTALVGILLIYATVIPPLAELKIINRHIGDLVFVGVTAVGAWFIFGHAYSSRSFLAFAMLGAILKISNIWLPDVGLRLWDALFMMGALASLTWLTVRYVLAAGPINFHRVLGAVAAFILIGLFFAQAHRLVAMHANEAYAWMGNPVDYDTIVPKLSYYSFVTLTSVGYGEIVPLHPVARSVAVVEMLIGMLYPAGLLGWLVSLATAIDKSHRPNADKRGDRADE